MLEGRDACRYPLQLANETGIVQCGGLEIKLLPIGLAGFNTLLIGAGDRARTLITEPLRQVAMQKKSARLGDPSCHVYSRVL